MDNISPAKKRRSRRSMLLMAASVEHDAAVTPVTLRNLSADGALVEGNHRLAAHMRIVFHKNDLAVAGRVAWTAGRRCGLAFDTSLDPETVLRYVPEPRPSEVKVVKRPGFRGPMSAEERKMFDEIVGERESE
jgi:hypothetical protein